MRYDNNSYQKLPKNMTRKMRQYYGIYKISRVPGEKILSFPAFCYRIILLGSIAIQED